MVNLIAGIILFVMSIPIFGLIYMYILALIVWLIDKDCKLYKKLREIIEDMERPCGEM